MIKLDSTNTYRAVAVDLFNDMDKAELTRPNWQGQQKKVYYIAYTFAWRETNKVCSRKNEISVKKFCRNEELPGSKLLSNTK